jgi:hypothetical protein
MNRHGFSLGKILASVGGALARTAIMVALAPGAVAVKVAVIWGGGELLSLLGVHLPLPAPPVGK